MFRDEGIEHVPNLTPAYAAGRMAVVWRTATAMRLAHAPPSLLAKVLAASSVEKPS